MDTNKSKIQFINYLSELISEKRRAKFDEVLNYRTRHITIALEDIYQPHNASAVLRTCDIFGIQDIHIIENTNEYSVSRDIALGSAQWLNLIKYNQSQNKTIDCIKQLKKKGYKIIATAPGVNNLSIDELPIDKPIALLFGTELTGVSDTVKEHADELVTIPMFGFTESFNISVSAALCLNILTKKMHDSTVDWKLKDDEKNELLLTWLKNSIRKVEFVEKEFYRKLNE